MWPVGVRSGIQRAKADDHLPPTPRRKTAPHCHLPPPVLWARTGIAEFRRHTPALGVEAAHLWWTGHNAVNNTQDWRWRAPAMRPVRLSFQIRGITQGLTLCPRKEAMAIVGALAVTPITLLRLLENSAELSFITRNVVSVTWVIICYRRLTSSITWVLIYDWQHLKPGLFMTSNFLPPKFELSHDWSIITWIII